MQTDARSIPIPFLLPFHERRGVERLRIQPIPPLGAPRQSRTAPVQGLSEALARLRSAGLVADAGRGPDLHILGGTSVSGDGEILAYQDSFGIFADPEDQLMAVVSGPGQFATEILVPTLAAAVEAVLRVYKDRGALPRSEEHP